jgi:pimeloyl-ACP methyl ester carboxylesterase
VTSVLGDPVGGVFPFATHELELDGHAYAYADEGEGPPVVLVHGNPTWAVFFRSLIGGLPRHGYRAIAPDHIGMGRSSKPRPSEYRYTLEQRIADFSRFMSFLDLDEPVTLVVHDWGGAIALGWAVEHLDEVGRLVLFNTAAFHLPPSKRVPMALGAVRMWPIGDLAVLHLNAFARVATTVAVTRRMPSEVRAAYLAPYDRPATRVATLQFVKDIPLAPDDAAYAAITRISDRLHVLRDRPVLICWGMKDFVFDDVILARWLEIYPHAEVHTFDQANHYVLEDASDEIVPIVGEFLATTSPSRSR